MESYILNTVNKDWVVNGISHPIWFEHRPAKK